MSKCRILVAAAATASLAGTAAAATHQAGRANGRIVYANGRGLMLMNPGGSGKVHVPGTRGSDTAPAWSPDGRQIALQSPSPRGDSDVTS